MSEKTFEGATVEAALEAAAAEIGAAVSDLDHEVVEKKEDFWGMGDATVVIKAWRRTPPAADADEIGEPAEEDEPAASAEQAVAVEEEKTAEEEEESYPGAASQREPAAAAVSPEAARYPTPEPAARAPLATDAQPGENSAGAPDAPVAADVVTPREDRGGQATERPDADAGGAEGVDPRDISSFLEQIFHDMEFECTVEVEAEEEGFLATIDGTDKDALLEGNGRCLSALELLANNAFRHKLPRGSKVRVDAGDFRNKRDEELSDLALQVAHSAKESGRTQETQPLNPYERRLVHLALAEDPAVTTRSRGSGFLKNVQVIPSTGGGNRTGGRRR